MQTISEIKFKTVIREGFHAVLKPLGFRKKANSFYLQLEEIGQIINIQKSSWGSKNSISFTINTGLFLPEHWMGMIYNQGKEVPIFPSEVDCIIRNRIGTLKKQHDTWYDISEKTDETLLVNEMQGNLTKYVLPYFEHTKTKDDLLHLLESKNLILAPLSKLIVYGEIKQLEKARAEYLNILREKISPFLLETVKAYGRKYGLE